MFKSEENDEKFLELAGNYKDYLNFMWTIRYYLQNIKFGKQGLKNIKEKPKNVHQAITAVTKKCIQ